MISPRYAVVIDALPESDFDRIGLPANEGLIVAELAFLRPLMRPASRWLIEVTPSFLGRSKLIEEAHRDGVSNLVFFEGWRAQELTEINRYDLLNLDDVKRLLADGLLDYQSNLLETGLRTGLRDYLIHQQRDDLLQAIVSHVEFSQGCIDGCTSEGDLFLTRLFRWAKVGDQADQLISKLLEKGLLQAADSLASRISPGKYQRLLRRMLHTNDGLLREHVSRRLLPPTRRKQAALQMLRTWPFMSDRQIEADLASGFSPECLRSSAVIDVCLAIGESKRLKLTSAQIERARSERASPPFFAETTQPLSSKEEQLQCVESGQFFYSEAVVDTLSPEMLNLCVVRAAKQGCLGLLKLFIARGGDITTMDNLAMGWARFRGFHRIAAYLETCGAGESSWDLGALWPGRGIKAYSRR